MKIKNPFRNKKPILEILENRFALSATHVESSFHEEGLQYPHFHDQGVSNIAVCYEQVHVNSLKSGFDFISLFQNQNPYVFPQSQSEPVFSIPAYHSNSTATKRIFLDFDGHTSSGTDWLDGNTFYSPKFDVDGDASSFSSVELGIINEIFQRVSEDFLPFDVDITTEDPGVEALLKSGVGDNQWGMRVVISNNTSPAPNAGGVAFIGSFGSANNTPCFVFPENLGNHPKSIAECVSHEVGHTLGLFHDGDSGSVYYPGHGSGNVSWAPIMGVSYGMEVTQWSKGEYGSANNSENDLAIITNETNGFGYRQDDYGSSISTSANLTIGASRLVNKTGIIETTSDLDFFQFSTADGGYLNLTVNPAFLGANLDIEARIHDANGVVIYSNNPADQTYANVETTLSPGTYYLSINGVGFGDPATNGYSDYGSLGYYTINGNLPGSSIPLIISGPNGATGTPDSNTSVDEGNTFVFDFSANKPCQWSIVGGQDKSNFSINSNSGILSFIIPQDHENPNDFDHDNYYEVILQATDPYGESSRQTVTVFVNDVPNEFLKPDIDNNTTLLLRMDDNPFGYAGERPVKNVGSSFSDGIRNRALNLDSGGYLQYPNSENIDPLQGTVEFWVKPNWNGNQNTTHLFFNSGHNFNNGMLLSIDGANNIRFIQWGDDLATSQIENYVERGVATSGAHWQAGNWYHLAASWDGTTGKMELFVNGNLVDSRTDGVKINCFSSTNMTIGADQFLSQTGNCTFDQIRISNVTRTPLEIRSSFLGEYVSPETPNQPGSGNRNQKYPAIIAMRSPFMDGSMELIDSKTMGLVKGNFTPFPGYFGGVQVQSGDFDGFNRGIVIAAGEGGAPHVLMMDASTGIITHSFFAYSTAFRGGLFIAVGDVNNDGADDFVTGPNAGGGPHIKVFDGRTASVLFEFMAYDSSFKGGVSVALADVNMDGRLDIVTGTGKGGGPHVCVFDGLNGQLLRSFMAFDSFFFGGIYVASGDIDRDGTAEIVTGMGSGSVPLVRIFNSDNLSCINQFYAYDWSFSGGVRVGLSDQNQDGILDIFTGAGPGGGPHVKVFHGINLNEIGGYFAGIACDPYGVYVSSGSGRQ